MDRLKRAKKRMWPKGMNRRDAPPFDRQLQTRSIFTADTAPLPLVHVTAAWTANEILRGGKFETRHCDVFDRHLVYFFVLRPAYRSRFGDEESHQITRFPVVFVLKPDALPDPVHVYPFDTGAAAKGVFAAQADRYVPLEDYALAADCRAPAGHIDWAFGSVEAYFSGLLRDGVLDGVPQSESVTRGFVDVAMMGRDGSNQHDRRASAIEVASSHDIDLAGRVGLVIFPKQYLEGNTALIDRVAALGIETDIYDWQPNRMPDDFQADIADLTRTWLRTSGYL